MKKHQQLIAAISCMALTFTAHSQSGPRYLSEIFASVTVSSNVTYGNNISVLTGTPSSIPLMMDVYQPAGDNLAMRPLVIILHAGSFLPKIANTLAVGSKSDSAVVEMCMRFARRGYVAVAMDHRLGWNPLGNQEIRTGTILNAVYRAIQDAKNCVRYFRNDAATANTYKVDVTKIAVGGFGAGGYVAIAYGSLNKPAEIQLAKFVDFVKNPPEPYVDQTVSGNFDGTDAAPLNTPNYPTYSSSVNVVFSMAGCVGDTSWIEPGETPIISIHSYKDPFAPYKTGPVIVTATGQFVVEASGGHDVIRRSQRLGNQAIFTNSVFNDVYSAKATINSPGLNGLYTLITPTPGGNLSCTGPAANPQTEQSAPWDWWNEPVFVASYNAYCACTNGTPVNCLNKRENPDMSATKGRAYLDTLQGFLNPRIVCALGLTGCVSAVGISELNMANHLSIYPNPATSEINFVVTNGKTIREVRLCDVSGKLILKKDSHNVTSCTLDRHQLKSGLYFVTVETSDLKSVTRKIVIE